MLQWFGLTQFSFFLGRICLSNRFHFGRSKLIFFISFLLFFLVSEMINMKHINIIVGRNVIRFLDIATDITSIFPQRQATGQSLVRPSFGAIMISQSNNELKDKND